MVEKKKEPKERKKRVQGGFEILTCRVPEGGFSEPPGYAQFNKVGEAMGSVADCEKYIKANAEQFDGLLVRIVQLKKEMTVTVKVKKIASF